VSEDSPILKAEKESRERRSNRPERREQTQTAAPAKAEEKPAADDAPATEE